MNTDKFLPTLEFGNSAFGENPPVAGPQPVHRHANRGRGRPRLRHNVDPLDPGSWWAGCLSLLRQLEAPPARTDTRRGRPRRTDVPVEVIAEMRQAGASFRRIAATLKASGCNVSRETIRTIFILQVEPTTERGQQIARIQWLLGFPKTRIRRMIAEWERDADDPGSLGDHGGEHPATEVAQPQADLPGGVRSREQFEEESQIHANETETDVFNITNPVSGDPQPQPKEQMNA